LYEKAVQARLRDHVRHVPMAARSLGVRIANRIPNAEDLARLARERLFVKIQRSG
jgi:hypothetical protein